MIVKPEPVDKRLYSPGNNEAPAFYGLPREVKFCRKCTYSNQKPNSEKEYKHTAGSKKPTVQFDEEGVCKACRAIEEKDRIDWALRRKELVELCDKYRRNDGRYDCLVPGSGGKDSFYQTWVLKHEFGMNPLTVTWAPHIYTDWGWKNFEAWINSGFANYLYSPNGKTNRLLTRLATEKLFHPFQPFMLGQMYHPLKMAAQLDIPLIFYGENPTEYGNADNDKNQGKKDWAYMSAQDPMDSYMGGTSVRELIEDYGQSKLDLEPFMPPTVQFAEKNKIDVRYLGYFMRWHPQTCYYCAVENSTFKAAPERNAGTYSKYSSIDDKMDDFHFYTTFIKFGIGKCTYDTAQEIRHGDITRDEGLSLVKRYDGEYPARFEKEFFEYLSISEKEYGKVSKKFEQPIVDRAYFDLLTDKHRSPHLWSWTDAGWKLRKQIF